MGLESFGLRLPCGENGAAQCAVNVPRNLQIAEKYATNGTHSRAGRLSKTALLSEAYSRFFM
jgi:hypothetical protein